MKENQTMNAKTKELIVFEDSKCSDYETMRKQSEEHQRLCQEATARQWQACQRMEAFGNIGYYGLGMGMANSISTFADNKEYEEFINKDRSRVTLPQKISIVINLLKDKWFG